MKSLKIVLSVVLVIILLLSLTFAREELVMPHIRMELNCKKPTSVIEIFSDGRLIVYYGGERKLENSVWQIDENGNRHEYAIEDEEGNIRYMIDGDVKEERWLTKIESKKIMETINNVKAECKTGYIDNMKPGHDVFIWIDGLFYHCILEPEYWGHNIELKALAYRLINLSRMKEMDYYKEYIPEDFFG